MCYHLGSSSKADLKVKLPKKEITYNQGEIFHVSGFARPYIPVTLNNNVGFEETARSKLLPFLG